MGRHFISVQMQGIRTFDIKESMFVLCAASRHVQLSYRPKILFFLDGRCQITLKTGFDESVSPGDIFILPTPCQHIYSSLSDTQDERIYTFGLFLPRDILDRKIPSWMQEMQKLLKQIMEKPLLLRNGLDIEMRHLIGEFRREHEENLTGYRVRLQAVCLSLLVSLARRLEHPPHQVTMGMRSTTYLINEVKEFMFKAKNSALTLGKIAWHVRLSEEYLARIFKQETGMTVMHYLRHLRVDAAKVYLLNSNDPIKTIAHRVGFSSTNPFCRTFKTIVGKTPMEYRVKHVGKSSDHRDIEDVR